MFKVLFVNNAGEHVYINVADWENASKMVQELRKLKVSADLHVKVRFSNVNTGEKVEIELTRAFAEEFVKLLNSAGMEATIVD